jgi:hypothetical protein
MCGYTKRTADHTNHYCNQDELKNTSDFSKCFLDTCKFSN